MKTEVGFRGRRRIIAEMNLIPLIDVSLILVVIFMVLTPILVQHQLTVKLPTAATGEAAASDNALTVQISREGALSVGGRTIHWSELEHELTLRLVKASSKTLLVQADKSVPVEKVVTVLDVAKKLGVGKLGVGVSSEAK